jgi:hypothetical protein
MGQWKYSLQRFRNLICFLFSRILDDGKMEVDGQLQALAALPLGKELITHWIGCWADPRASLDTAEKIKFS